MIPCCSGAATLPRVEVDTYNAELRDDAGFIGDRASRRAFRAILDDWRNRIGAIVASDPLEQRTAASPSKKKLDRVHRSGKALAVGVLHTAIEEFAQELATVVLRFLELPPWKDTQRIVVGGGLSSSRIGEVMIGRASVLVKAAGHSVTMVPIRHHADDAALIGGAYLAPSWVFADKDAILAVDIGGTNIRAGVVELRLDQEPNLSACRVHSLELWRYGDEKPRPTRDAALDRLVTMLEDLVLVAEADGLTLAPLVCIACPGVIASDGTIERGGQNLPGNWEGKGFNLAKRIQKRLPRIGDHETTVIMHNDAVVQGLSEVPFMQDVDHWGVLTIGTGLGNARFTNRTLHDVKGEARGKAPSRSRSHA